MDVPISYKDPAYDAIDRRVEAQVGLKPGVLSAIRLHGERSNANQVSNAGARTVYQITPPTRNLILKKYGVDSYLSPQNAALGSALILKEGHDRNGGNTAEAVREYIGGTNPKNWGKTTMAYVDRVTKALNPINTAEAQDFNTPDLKAEYDAWVAKQQQSQQAPVEQAQEQNSPANDDEALKAEYDAWVAKQQAPVEQQQEQNTPSPLSLNPYKVEAMGAGVLNNVLSPQQESQLPEAGSNLAQRMGADITNIGQGVIDTVRHPIQTVENAAGLIRGGMQSALPDSVTNALIKDGITPDSRPQFNQFAQGLKDSYGSSEAIAKTMHDRPVSTALNVAGLVTGGVGLLRNAPSELATVAPTVDAWTQAPLVSSQLAQATARNASSAGATFAGRALAEGVSPEIAQTIGQAEQIGILNETAAGRHIEASTLPVPVPLTEGAATGNGRMLSMERNLRGKYSELSDHAAIQNNKLAENIPAIQAQAAPDIFGGSHIDDGQILIDAYKLKDKAANAIIKQNYTALKDANGGEFPIDARSFVNIAAKNLSSEMKAKFLPPEIRQDLVELKKLGSMTFEQFENMRTTLANEARKYAPGLNADGNRFAAVNIVRDALEGTPIIDGATIDVKNLADIARKSCAIRKNLIANDPAYQAAIWGKTKKDYFTKKFVINGDQDGIASMAANLAHDPLAAQAINNAVIRHLADKAKIIDGEGKFASASYNNALNALEPKLMGVVDPNTLTNLRKLGNVAKYIYDQPVDSFINNSNTHVARLAEYGSGLAHKAPGLGAVMDIHSKNLELQQIRDAIKPGAGLINKQIGN